MPKKKLNQYKGMLTPAQIAAGMNAANGNARKLVKAASMLLENGEYPLAASLATLSIEESGKLPILRSLAVARTKEEVNQCWKEYRSHTKKNVMWLLPQLVSNGARRLDDFKILFEEDAKHTFLLDQVKQLGFYTDCLGKTHWSVPVDVIDKELATLIVNVARLFARDREIKQTEVELWVKHIGPVWKGPKELMEHALVQWYKEMQEMRLAKEGENEMKKFILYGIGSKDI